MNNTEPKPSFYCTIPFKIIEDDKLTNNEKLLYTAITALTDTYGSCYAKSEYFAEILKMSKQKVVQAMYNLEKRGYVQFLFNMSGNPIRLTHEILG